MALRRVAFALLAGQLAPAAVALSFAQDPAAKKADLMATKDQWADTSSDDSGDNSSFFRSFMFTKDRMALGLPSLLPPGPEKLKDLPSTAEPTTVAAPVDEAADSAVRSQNRKKQQSVAVGDEHCGKLSAKLDEQLRAVLARRRSEGHESRPLVWTVIDSSYAAWALDQQAQLESAAKLPFVAFVSVDLNKSVARDLCQQGLPTIDFSVEYGDDWGGDGYQQPISWTTKYRVAKAKFLLPVHLLRHDVANIFVEGDIFWLRDPVPYFESALRAPAGNDVPQTKPSILVPTHHTDPNSINIGLWYVPQGAHEDLGVAFELMWNLMRTFYTTEVSANPGKLFDQGVFIDVLGSAFRVPKRLSNCSWHATGFNTNETDHYCKEIELARTRFLTTLGGRKLGNDLIDCSTRVLWSEETLAAHVLLQTPLAGAEQKVSMAKLQGVFIGRPSYYENVPSPTATRFIAWDGDYSGVTLEQFYCRYPLFGAPPCGAAVAVPLMAALGQRLRREVVLPQTVDVYGTRRPAETFFDVANFQHKFGINFRESSFLYNMRLNTTNMYPVARLRVTTEGWAAVQRIAKEGSEPTTDFYSVPAHYKGGPGVAAILNALFEVPGVNDAKLVLLRFANAVDWELQRPDHVNQQVAQLQGPSARQQDNSSVCFTTGFLCEVGDDGPDKSANHVKRELTTHEICVRKCER